MPAQAPSTPWLRALVATLVLALALWAAKAAFNAPPPPEMLFNFTAHLLGVPWVFNLIHSLPNGLDAYAKYALFGTTVLIFLGVWFSLGLAYGRTARAVGRWAADAAYAALMVVLVGIVLMPLQGLGLFGLSPNNFQYPPLPSHLWAAAFGLIFALVLHLWDVQSRSRTVDLQRRESVRMVVSTVALMGAATALGQLFLRGLAYAQDAAAGLVSRIQGLSEEITPTPDHYQVSKNVFNPEVSAERWTLEIKGMVDNPLSLTLDDLMNLPSIERTSTLTCISNQVGGDLIGNSLWTGVLLQDLLETAGVQAGATELILRAADNYSDSFPLEVAQREGNIVAYLQNGEPLTRDHGAPARVLVPGIYGMKNVKWVTEIELVDSDYQGYWQQRGWSDSAVVQTMSRIDTAQATMLEDGSAAIGGVAFAGLRGVAQVEVSTDMGATWQVAKVKPAENDLSWNLWGFSWQAQAGTYQVWVRATDGEGTVQPETRARPLPDGATGYHMFSVRVG